MARALGFASSLAPACLLLGLASTAAAQPQPQEPDITVLADQPGQLRDQVTDYVRQLGIVHGDRPAARWIDPVCPHVIGLPPALAPRVVAQVRTVAASVGAPVASGKCEANLLLAFTEDAAGLVKEISKRGPLGDIGHEERKSLETGTAPVRWWYSTEIRNADGTPTDTDGSPAVQTASAGVYANYGSFGMAARSGSSSGGRASLISVPTLRAIRHATVVIDVNRSTGKKLSSVVDYAALVGLAEVRQGAAPSGSLLNLFNSADFQRLSNNDLALLKGLYSMPLARKAEQHRRSLVTNVVKARMEARPN